MVEGVSLHYLLILIFLFNIGFVVGGFFLVKLIRLDGVSLIYGKTVVDDIVVWGNSLVEVISEFVRYREVVT